MTSHSVRIASPYPNTAFTHTGRGGSGNIQRTSTATKSGNNSNAINRDSNNTAPRPSVSSTSSISKSRAFTTGRGGAGNTHPIAQKQDAIFSFDEELVRFGRGGAASAADHHSTRNGNSNGLAPICHIGRGGAGNLIGNSSSSSAAAARRQSRWSSSSGSGSGSDDDDQQQRGGVDRRALAMRSGSDRGSISSADSSSSGAHGNLEDGTQKKRSWLGRLGK